MGTRQCDLLFGGIPIEHLNIGGLTGNIWVEVEMVIGNTKVIALAGPGRGGAGVTAGRGPLTRLSRRFSMLRDPFNQNHSI